MCVPPTVRVITALWVMLLTTAAMLPLIHRPQHTPPRPSYYTPLTNAGCVCRLQCLQQLSQHQLVRHKTATLVLQPQQAPRSSTHT